MYKYDDLDIIVTSYGKQCLLETTDNEFKIASAVLCELLRQIQP